MNETFKKDSLKLRSLLRLIPRYGMRFYKFYHWDNPYKPSVFDRKAIFVHIPKCAGMSVSEAIYGEQIGHHFLWAFEAHGEKTFQEFYKFTFVRNPWDRILSAYTFLKKGGINPADQAWADTYLHDIDSFEEFIHRLEDNQYKQIIIKTLHFIPQCQFLENFSGKPELDFVGRFENIREDFEIVRRKLGLSYSLPTKNQSSHLHYSQYFTSQMEKIVREMYQEDIELLKYQFKAST